MTSKQLYVEGGAGVPPQALERIIKKLEYSTRDAGYLCEWPQLLRDLTEYPDVYETHSKEAVKNSPVKIECNTPLCPDRVLAYVRLPGEDWYHITTLEYEDVVEAALSYLISAPRTEWVKGELVG